MENGCYRNKLLRISGPRKNHSPVSSWSQKDLTPQSESHVGEVERQTVNCIELSNSKLKQAPYEPHH